MAQDTSSVTSTSEPARGAAVTISSEGNAGNSTINGQNQPSSTDGEGRGKKKSSVGRGRGIGAVPKGRGPAPPGWTGAGFDVDGRG